MHKDFSGWHRKKSIIDGLTAGQYYREREIWWVAIGHNVGTEENGKGADFSRPVLILRKFGGSQFYGVPLSTTPKRGVYYHPLNCQDDSVSVALLSHMRDYDSKRLIRKHTVVDEEEFEALQRKLVALIIRA